MADSKKKLNVLQELRKLDEKALAAKIGDLRRESVEQHQANAAGELPSSAAISKTRKEIAKALTLLREKQAVQTSKEEEK